MKKRRLCLRGLLVAVWAVLACSLPGLLPGQAARQPTSRPAATSSAPAGDADKIVIDAKARTVTIPAEVARQGRYDVLKGAIEYVLVTRGGKDYETVFLTDCSARQIHAALLKIGLKPGRPAEADSPPRGPGVNVLAEYRAGGKKVRRAIDEFVAYVKTGMPAGRAGKPLKPGPWTFTGSSKTTDPRTKKPVLQASLTGSIIGLHHTDPSPLFQNPRPEARRENIYRANVKALPRPGARVRIIFQRVLPKIPKGTRRVHLFISGRVQGVGFRAFTASQARRLKLTGWVRNLRDGRVEAVVEGPREKVAKLLEKLRRGPRPARVRKLQADDEPPEGEFKDFEIRF